MLHCWVAQTFSDPQKILFGLERLSFLAPSVRARCWSINWEVEFIVGYCAGMPATVSVSENAGTGCDLSSVVRGNDWWREIAPLFVSRWVEPTKKTLKIHRGLGKAASTLIVQMRTEKIGLKKFLHSRKVPGFDSPECPCRRGLQSAKHLLIECRLHTRESNSVWEEDRRKVSFGRIAWEGMLTNPKFAKKAAQFMKSLGIIDQFSSAIIEQHFRRLWQRTKPLRQIEEGPLLRR